ncbi:MAG: bifunctional riboflavin kinase/FAD synthetase [Anaerolineae bacterium]|nr:bifunctional riboflavin kinase/FAD synthetase [Anaerolineae bacterium]
MQHYLSIDNIKLQKSWLTIGSFDGVHLGHQKIVRELATGAHEQGVPAVVLTFNPHPAAILRNKKYPFYLTNLEERTKLLADMGADIIITHPFNQEVMQTSAKDFMAKLQQHLHMRHLKIGYDFALGKGREGNFQKLDELGLQMGYSIDRVKALEYDGQIVSSSRIRFLLGVGEVVKVGELLARNYTVAGKVVLGDQRGRKLGFPTANLSIWTERAIPAAGVYVCRVFVRDETWDAVTNIGVRPTFGVEGAAPQIESHILDFDDDIYGENLRVEFLSRIRGEQRFDNINELVKQIQVDISTARKLLAA